MIKKLDEILQDAKVVIGESEDTAAIELLENITDTVKDLEAQVAEAGDWKTRYETNDAEWKKKYKERFFEGIPESEVKTEEEEKPIKTFDDLFKED